jgi:DNA-binding MarR family transcriptional regulator
MDAEKNNTEAQEWTGGDGALSAALPSWTFLSTHGQVLLSVARRPDIRMREVAAEIKITERAVQRIVKDLEQAGYLTRARSGRRNRYEVHIDRPMRHALLAHRQVRDLLGLIGAEAPPRDPS